MSDSDLAPLAALPCPWLNPGAMRREEYALFRRKVAVMLNGLSCVICNGGRQIDRAILLVSAMLCSADARHRALRRLSRGRRQQGRRGMARRPARGICARNSSASSGARRNDIGEQMRNGARRMTPKEIEAASQFYADRP